MVRVSATQRHVAFHFPDLSSGGVEKMRIALATEFLRQGYAVDFVLCNLVGSYVDLVPKDVRIIDLGSSRTLLSMVPLTRYLRKEKPDAIISSLGPQNIATVIAANFSGFRGKVLVTQHNAVDHQARKTTIQHSVIPWLYKIFLPLADYVIAVSGGVAANISQLVPKLKAEKLVVIYNPAFSSEAPTDTTSDLAFSATGAKILAVGRLIPQKGFDVLIQAVAELSEALPCELTIIGEGPDAEYLKNMVSELGLETRVRLVGFQSDPKSFMREADLVVLSSHYEGLGNVIIEALGCGTKVVSTNCEFGPSEILKDGEFGTLVAVGNPSALAEGIRVELNTPRRKDQLVERAADFSPLQAVNRHIDLIYGSEL